VLNQVSDRPVRFAAGTRVTDGDWEVTVIEDVFEGAKEMNVRDDDGSTEPVPVDDFWAVET
jgi:hypothetical protein